MKTSQAIRLAKGVSALSRVFRDAGLSVTRQAVQQWGESIPPLREYQLKELRPHWFKAAKK